MILHEIMLSDNGLTVEQVSAKTKSEIDKYNKLKSDIESKKHQDPKYVPTEKVEADLKAIDEKIVDLIQADIEAMSDEGDDGDDGGQKKQKTEEGQNGDGGQKNPKTEEGQDGDGSQKKSNTEGSQSGNAGLMDGFMGFD